jgi:hypothetical protein
MAGNRQRAGQLSRAGFGAARNDGAPPLVWLGRHEMEAAPEALYSGAASSRMPVPTTLERALAVAKVG